MLLYFFAFSVITNGFQEITVFLAEKENAITAADPYRIFTWFLYLTVPISHYSLSCFSSKYNLGNTPITTIFLASYYKTSEGVGVFTAITFFEKFLK